MAINYSDKLEIIEVIDSEGKVVGTASRGETCDKGLLHQAVNIVIFNRKGQIFIQKRSAKKAAFGLFWDISASEHLKSGEDYKSAAVRGLKEELAVKAGLRLLRRKHVQTNKYQKNGRNIIENELVELYGGVYSGKISINKDEVERGMFITLSNLIDEIANGDIKFTPWGLDEVNFLQNHTKVMQKLVRRI